jgi:hypothetical protein
MTRRRAITWTIIFLVVAAGIFLAVPLGQPWTVASAVRRIEREITDDDRNYILRNSKDTATSMLHMSLGMYVRNEFGLWGRNWILRASCGRTHPDDCSGVILDALWESIRRRESPETLRALDEHFQRVQAAKIDYTGFHLIRIGDLISRMQSQLDQQAPTPGSQLRLVTSGNPNLDCFTRADFDGEPVPLELFLGWIGWRNGFSVRHNPPSIELMFHEPCAWPEPPKHFTPTK